MTEKTEPLTEIEQRILDKIDVVGDHIIKVTGMLADYEQRLRTLVDALADEELFHESTQVAYAEAQKLLAEAPTTAT